MSLNAWGGARYDALAAWLPTSGADVVCLQEVTRTRGLSGWTSFADAERTLPQRADLFADVGALLPDHRGVFVPAEAGPVTDPSGRRHRQEFGLGTFVGPGATLLAERSAFVHGDFVEDDDWTASPRPRTAHALTVLPGPTTPPGEAARPVTVVHLHGLRDPAGKHDTPARAAQAQRLAALVEAARRPGDLCVVCGDLNLLPDSATFAVLGDLGLVDLVGTADTRTSLYPKPVRHANYLLVSEPAAVQRFEIVCSPQVSDHAALLLEV